LAGFHRLRGHESGPFVPGGMLFSLTSEKPRIIVEINDNTGFIPSFLSESN
jgi:hypothetical protein